MKVVNMKITEIFEYTNNAKLHPAEQIEQIKNSILEFGFNDPIAIDENNTIIEGNGRLQAAKELGMEEIP
jgi:ParB-like chromosome segregation protein Spo0J